MKCVLLLTVVSCLLGNTLVWSKCQIYTSQSAKTVTLQCTELKLLTKYLEKARPNTTSIVVSDSVLNSLEGHAFAKFGATLVSLDLHESGIETINSLTFIGLTKLEKLILWGNKLTAVPEDWFVNMYNLRTLDLSFNYIQRIDYSVFQRLPYLEEFYFDYNQLSVIDFSMFVYMRNLKKVKFGKNPWNWAFRARLTWQLENQNVGYDDDWEDWSWMSTIIKKCIEIGDADLPSDKVLDCVVEKLLDFTYDAFKHTQSVVPVKGGCFLPASMLVRCMRPQNSTGNTDDETIRRILENYATVLLPMHRANSPFRAIST